MSAAPVVSGAHPGTEQETDKQDPFSLSLSLSPSVSFSLPLPLSLHQCVQKATCLSPRHVPSSQPRGPGCFPGQPHGPRGPSSLPRFPRTLPLVQHEACWGSLLSMPLPLLVLLLTLATNFWVSPLLFQSLFCHLEEMLHERTAPPSARAQKRRLPGHKGC